MEYSGNPSECLLDRSAAWYRQFERNDLLAPTHVYIVGAGFSMHAGLPLQAQFTEALLEDPKKVAHDIAPVTIYLREFVHDVFDHSRTAKAKFWPELEDVFTNIDLAANTGHHLGQHHLRLAAKASSALR